ncbi:MAG: hypothetical protein CML20_14725 [Rheinheimera sp.]|nr:hypothetical protein [Rheinheimera sp.]
MGKKTPTFENGWTKHRRFPTMASTNEKKEVCIDGTVFAVQPHIRSLFASKRKKLIPESTNEKKEVCIDGTVFAVQPHIRSLFASKRKKLMPEIS